MFDDLWKSTQASLAERLTNPLASSFIIAWAAWNYKFIVILLSNASVTTTFSLIEKLAFPDTKTILLKGITYPLISALIYLFGYPYPSKFVIEFTKRRQRAQNESLKKIEGDVLLSLDESREIKIAAEKKVQILKDQVNALNKEIANLSAENNRLKSMESSNNSSKRQDLSESQLNVIKTIGGHGGSIDINTLLKEKISEDPVRINYDLDHLDSLNFISQYYDADILKYRLNQKGRECYLQSQSTNPA